jgi:hypothetical protein
MLGINSRMISTGYLSAGSIAGKNAFHHQKD